jgi:hypothetical protein
MNTVKVKTKRSKFAIFSVIARFFVIMFRLMTFTIKSEYGRWFEIASGLSIWLNVFVIVYSILKGLNVL